jgi:hypothetical protein
MVGARGIEPLTPTMSRRFQTSNKPLKCLRKASTAAPTARFSHESAQETSLTSAPLRSGPGAHRRWRRIQTNSKYQGMSGLRELLRRNARSSRNLRLRIFTPPQRLLQLLAEKEHRIQPKSTRTRSRRHLELLLGELRIPSSNSAAVGLNQQ